MISSQVKSSQAKSSQVKFIEMKSIQINRQAIETTQQLQNERNE